MGGRRDISRDGEQGKCGRRVVREGGWEVRRIPRGLVKALHNKFFEMFLSSSRENLNLECDSQSGRLKEAEIYIQRSRNGVYGKWDGARPG